MRFGDAALADSNSISESLTGQKILVGVSGGIAAYKSATLVSRLVQAGASCQVLMTDSATRFIGEATFLALSGKPVARNLFDERFPLGPHIELARDYDWLVVAPATANFFAKAANGIADDLLSTLILSFTGTRVYAPAMNCEMWENPAVQRNVKQVANDGATLVGPEEGWLSCRVKGKGRMAEPEQILEVIAQLSS